MQLSFTPDEIAAIVQPRARRGATGATICGISALGTARPGELSFLGNPRYKSEVTRTKASVVLVPREYAGKPRSGQLFLVVDQPSVALARVCARIEPLLWPAPPPGVHPSAVIAAGVKVAATATVGPLCVVEAGAVIGERTHLQASVFIGRNAVVGDDCRLMPGVRLYAECRIGHRVRVHANTVIGSDGFGYELVGGRHEKVPQIGTAIIEDDVEIGAGCAVDRARFGRTVVGEGTKIDNLVQVGHNATIGRHCILCGQVGISGSATIGDYAVLGGQVGVAGHITIGQGAKVGGGSGIARDVPAGSSVNGYPALPMMLERRIAVLKQRLPELFRRVDALEAQIRKHSARK